MWSWSTYVIFTYSINSDWENLLPELACENQFLSPDAHHKMQHEISIPPFYWRWKYWLTSGSSGVERGRARSSEVGRGQARSSEVGRGRARSSGVNQSTIFIFGSILEDKVTNSSAQLTWASIYNFETNTWNYVRNIFVDFLRILSNLSQIPTNNFLCPSKQRIPF